MIKVKEKKMKNKIISCLLVLFILSLSLMTQLVVPAYADPKAGEETASADDSKDQADETEAQELKAEEDGTVVISTTEEFLEVAQACSLDTWSQGKTIVLDADISLENTEYLPIPTFGGTFDGKGYTISGLTITNSVTPAGLFGVLQETGVVKNLNVSGDVSPSGDADVAGGIAGENNGTIENCTYTGSVSGKQNTGGIAGINGTTGNIKKCNVSGTISGENMTGGIAGYNLGEIASSQNDSYVNIESVDPSLSPEDINLDFLTDVSKLYSLDTSMAASDTGGIAGYSSGILTGCSNNGTVGYQHIGYNVGGIAGRSSGHISGCTNNVSVFGRKDVGGIVGQMEPYIAANLSEDTLTKLQNQMDELSTMIDNAVNGAGEGMNSMISRLNSMADYLDAAAAAANNIKTTGSINSIINGSGQASGEGSATVTPPQAEVGGSIEKEGNVEAEAGGSVSAETGGNASAESGTSAEAGAGGSTSVKGEAHAGLSSGSAEGNQSGSASGTVSSSTQVQMNTSLHNLSSAVNGLTGQMRLLDGELAGSAGSLTGDIKAINSQVNTISNTLFNAMLGTGEDNEILKDTSDINIEEVIYGKVGSSQNSGKINGDINVGGIVGTMAIEYELDPEDDDTSSVSGRNRREFELKAILIKCCNTGKVSAKRNYTGSVCGHMDLGLISECEGYGDTESENGDYVGGIAGVASGIVRNSYAKCTLKGKNYIGGIVGTGVTADKTGSSSSVTGCYAQVDIPEYEQYAGGISGAEEGEFADNYYVSDDLAAINRMSYSGKAEPIEYSKLLEVEGLPEEFKQLTVQFVAENETLKTVTCNYGESLDDSVYPEIPQRKGCYAKWDITELTDLRFDEPSFM